MYPHKLLYPITLFPLTNKWQKGSLLINRNVQTTSKQPPRPLPLQYNHKPPNSPGQNTPHSQTSQEAKRANFVGLHLPTMRFAPMATPHSSTVRVGWSIERFPNNFSLSFVELQVNGVHCTLVVFEKESKGGSPCTTQDVNCNSIHDYVYFMHTHRAFFM